MLHICPGSFPPSPPSGLTLIDALHFDIRKPEFSTDEHMKKMEIERISRMAFSFTKVKEQVSDLFAILANFRRKFFDRRFFCPRDVSLTKVWRSKQHTSKVYPPKTFLLHFRNLIHCRIEDNGSLDIF